MLVERAVEKFRETPISLNKLGWLNIGGVQESLIYSISKVSIWYIFLLGSGKKELGIEALVSYTLFQIKFQ